MFRISVSLLPLKTSEIPCDPIAFEVLALTVVHARFLLVFASIEPSADFAV